MLTTPLEDLQQTSVESSPSTLFLAILSHTVFICIVVHYSRRLDIDQMQSSGKRGERQSMKQSVLPFDPQGYKFILLPPFYCNLVPN